MGAQASVRASCHVAILHNSTVEFATVCQSGAMPESSADKSGQY